jgi:hypothetical protein
MRTTPRQDFSGDRVVCNDSKTGLMRVGRQGRTAIEPLTKMDVNLSFFDVMSEVQKDSQDVYAGRGQFKKI